MTNIESDAFTPTEICSKQWCSKQRNGYRLVWQVSTNLKATRQYGRNKLIQYLDARNHFRRFQTCPNQSIAREIHRQILNKD